MFVSLPWHLSPAARQRARILFEQKFPEAKNVFFYVFFPVDFADVKLKVFTIFGGHVRQQIPNIVIGETPLMGGKVFQTFDRFGQFVLHFHHAEWNEISNICC